MNSHVIIWSVLFIALAAMTFQRPIWGFALYCLTIFAHPGIWWWGYPFASLRVSFVAGTIFLISSVIHFAHHSATRGPASPSGAACRWAGWLGLLMLANATVVHFFLALNDSVSWETYLLNAKHTLFFILAMTAVRNQSDFRIMVLTLVIGLAYFGYEVVIHEEGSMIHGRLEKIGRPGFTGSNALAMTVISILPLAGGLMFIGKGWQRAIGAFASATGLEVLVRCNTRGAWLGLIVGGMVLLAVTRGPARRKVLAGFALGLVAAGILVSAQVSERFMTTFASAEERDKSASNRLLLWGASLNMIAKRPLGSGGSSFEFSRLGEQMRQEARAKANVEWTAAATHNGYLSYACDWGLQGLLLKYLLLGITSIALWKTMRQCSRAENHSANMIGGCIFAAISCYLVKDGTGDHSVDDLFFWLITLAACFVKVHTVADEPAEGALIRSPVAFEGAAAHE